MSIENVSGVRADISEMLSKIREMSNKSKVFIEDSGIAATNATAAPSVAKFDDVLSMAKNAIDNVSQTQAESERLKNSYVTGDSDVSMSQVIVASQKSKLAFEGLISVRNKILEAYKEIMNMSV